VLAVLLTLSARVQAAPVKIYSDVQDGYVDSFPTPVSWTTTMDAGDTGVPQYRQAFVKFSLSGISGTLSSATLYLYMFCSYLDGVYDGTSPLTNPGLGDCVVRHINDYGTLDGSDLNAASILNDPGVLLSSSATPNVGYVSIDVKAAMQDDINKGRAFSSFMIKMITNTDADPTVDEWEFYTSEQSGTSQDPYVEYAIGAGASSPSVGGVVLPTNTLTVLAPYFTLIGLVATAMVAVKRIRRA